MVDVSDIFYFFSARGGGRGSPRLWEGGRDRFLIENPRRGGVSRTEDGRGLQRIGELGGVGAKYFFRGQNVHQVISVIIPGNFTACYSWGN